VLWVVRVVCDLLELDFVEVECLLDAVFFEVVVSASSDPVKKAVTDSAAAIANKRRNLRCIENLSSSITPI